MAQKLLTPPAVRIEARWALILVALVLWAPTTGTYDCPTETVGSQIDRRNSQAAPGQAGQHLVGLTPPSPGAEPVCPEGIDSGWWDRVQDDIARSEYHIRWQEGVEAYQSPNRVQNLRFTYRGEGFSVEPRTYEEASPPWKVALRLAVWGREEERNAFLAGELRAEGNRAIAEGRGVTVTYRNDLEGMRQDFLVTERPPGSGPLHLCLDVVATGVAMGVESDGRCVSFTRAVSGGGRVLSYGDLEVRDARGRLLRAEMVRENEEVFAIVADDQDAVYPVLVDPLSSSPDWIAGGNQPAAYFGCSVATAGDVNGDGYSDVIVGASGYDNGEPNEGRAFVYHGSPGGLAYYPDWTAEINQANAHFGTSVATAGDVNGDGCSDVIVGASDYGNGQTYEGGAFVYHGSPAGLDGFPDWATESNQDSTYFGTSVATAGDVNGDGYSDVIVGAPFPEAPVASEALTACDNRQERGEGWASVYQGGPTGLDTFPAWTAGDGVPGGMFGCSVATAGDVNGDSYSDVIVGAEGSYEGRAYVYHGAPAGLDTLPAWTDEGDQNGARFGNSVATAGDVNGDGYSDVIVGAEWYDNGETNEGRAYVYHGGPSGLAASPNWTATSNQDYAEFGISVATAGDVNGDGYSDVIIGASGYDNGEPNEGRAYVYHGSSLGLAASPDWTAESNQASAYFGHSVATAGDVNGDGCSDVIVGAYYHDNPETDEGQAYVYHGSSAGLDVFPAWGTGGGQADARLGCSVATAGDVNGDGYSDVIVGAMYYDNGETNEGRAYVHHGSPTGLDSFPEWWAESDQASAYFGSSVATAGDVNGDGYSDVIVGAYGYNNGEPDEGWAYVYHGGPGGLGVSAAWTGEGNQNGARFGSSVATAGDVNGDGYSDVIVGADLYNHGEPNEGRAFVYHGGPAGLDAFSTWTAESDQASARFGWSVATTGDVNGDGYSDVIVGAYAYDNPETNEGRAYVYHGGPAGLDTLPAWTDEGDQDGAFFGNSVATAGDVDGDGYSDVIVGADSYDNGEVNEGRAYVYHGSATGLGSSPDWWAESDQNDARFGHSVATAGDVNGDGYSDVIVGAYFYDSGATDDGRAYVYHGSSTGLTAFPDWTGEYNQTDAHFGISVATAGDVNGDGYSDVIVGADEAGTVDDGRAILYYGNDGDGLHVLPQQWKTDLATPVVPALKTRSQSQAGVGLLARTFFGRSDVSVQFEVKPLGTPFAGTGLVTTGWMDPGTTGASVSEIIGGLSDRTMYRWRARVGYRLSDGAPQPHGRWVYQPYNGGLGEADFQVSDDDLPPNVPQLHITRLSASMCRLSWHPVTGAWFYMLYRGTSAFFPPGTPWQAVAAPDTSYALNEGVGDPATNYYFLCRSVGAWGESGDSDRVGEFDLGTATAVTGNDQSQPEVEQKR